MVGQNAGKNSRGKSPFPTPGNDRLDAFPEAVRVKPKTPRRGGRGLRPRWKEPNGTIYEWDSLHGTVEKYNSKGTRHLGEFDPITGEQVSGPNPIYKVEP